MASQRVERVLRAYDAWNRDDFEAVVHEMHPDVEWHSSGLFPGLEPVSYGIEGVRAWWRALKEPFASFDIQVQRHWETADAVVTWLHFDAIGKGSGVEVNLRFAHIFDFGEDDLMVRYRSFTELDEALEAAGVASD